MAVEIEGARHNWELQQTSFPEAAPNLNPRRSLGIFCMTHLPWRGAGEYGLSHRDPQVTAIIFISAPNFETDREVEI